MNTKYNLWKLHILEITILLVLLSLVLMVILAPPEVMDKIGGWIRYLVNMFRGGRI